MFSKKEFANISFLRIISRTNFILSWVEHEKSFINPFYILMCLNNARWMANSADPEHTPHSAFAVVVIRIALVCLFQYVFPEETSKVSVIFGLRNHVSCSFRKHTFRHVCLAKIPISLCICAVWSESVSIDKAVKFLSADNSDSDQTALMLRLIWVFVGYKSEGTFPHFTAHLL